MPILFAYDGFQLIDVTHKKQLLASKRFAHITAIDAQHAVDEVDDVGSHHRNLVDDDELKFTKKLAFLSVVLQRFPDVPHIVSAIIGQERVKRKLEETMQSGATGIDGGNARRCQHHMFLLCCCRDVSKECRLARPRFAGQEKRLTGELNDLERVLQFLVVAVDMLLFLRCHQS